MKKYSFLSGVILALIAFACLAPIYNPPTGGGGVWGAITGTLSSQSDLNTALGLKAPLASPALTGNPTAPTQTANNNSTRIATTAYVETAIAAVPTPAPTSTPAYLVYTALLTQTGTDAPVATVLENTLSGAPVFSYTNTGTYTMTLTGAFPENKVPPYRALFDVSAATVRAVEVVRHNDDEITITVSRDGLTADSRLSGDLIEIRVYP